MLQSWGDRDAARVHSGGVNAAYLTPDGASAVTVSKDHTARVWNVTTAECRCVLRGELQTSVSTSLLVHPSTMCEEVDVQIYTRAITVCITMLNASALATCQRAIGEQGVTAELLCLCLNFCSLRTINK